MDPAVTRVSVRLPALSYTVVANPWGTTLSMLISGALSMMPFIMPTPTLIPTEITITHRNSRVLKKPRKILLAYLRELEAVSFSFFSVAFFP